MLNSHHRSFLLELGVSTYNVMTDRVSFSSLTKLFGANEKLLNEVNTTKTELKLYSNER